MNRPKRRPLPEELRAAFAWTDAAGELDLLASLTGEDLVQYALESTRNAREHGEHDVFAHDLRDLAEWLRAVSGAR